MKEIFFKKWEELFFKDFKLYRWYFNNEFRKVEAIMVEIKLNIKWLKIPDVNRKIIGKAKDWERIQGLQNLEWMQNLREGNEDGLPKS